MPFAAPVNLAFVTTADTASPNTDFANDIVFMFCGSIPLCGYIGLYWPSTTALLLVVN
jgi:hypothetical protein